MVNENEGEIGLKKPALQEQVFMRQILEEKMSIVKFGLNMHLYMHENDIKH